MSAIDVPGTTLIGTTKPKSGVASVDPVTEELRRDHEHPFAMRPMGALDEEFQSVREVSELADTIRLAVEENGRRARKAKVSLVLKEANELCLEFWRDAARYGINFGFPPNTRIVLSRMYDWQEVRVYIAKQRRINYAAQGEMRDVLEKCWGALMFPGESRIHTHKDF